MTDGTPTACSLDASDLRRRLNEIAEVGAESLIERSAVGERHLLRFRSDPETRRRLATIVAAEAKCCSFLDLSLEGKGAELVLAVSAPQGGQPVADELAAAFAGGTRVNGAEPRLGGQGEIGGEDADGVLTQAAAASLRGTSAHPGQQGRGLPEPAGRRGGR